MKKQTSEFVKRQQELQKRAKLAKKGKPVWDSKGSGTYTKKRYGKI